MQKKGSAYYGKKRGRVQQMKRREGDSAHLIGRADRQV
ncbi:hypothetical protein FB99_15140 [Pantoea agglomerans]|nr:hypothetical protein FB99_15140 [Pantoea agglomerans]